jgi:hypothetical protein
MKKFIYKFGAITATLIFIIFATGFTILSNNKIVTTPTTSSNEVKQPIVFGDGGGTIGVLPFRLKISATDTTPGYILTKLVAGANVTLTQDNTGGNETLTISSSGGGGGGGSPGGLNTQVQFNDSSSFGGDAGFTYVKATDTVTIGQIIDSGLTASRAVVSDGSKQLTSSTTTATEIGYVNGVTSAIQTQLNSKQATITFGTGVLTALGINIGSAGAPVLFNGAGGTPSSITLTNATGLPIAGLTGLGTGVGTALAVNVGSSGAVVVNGGALGTPSSGVATNLTGTASGLSIGGNAATATALFANGTNCSAGSAPLGVDASGNSESCTTYEVPLIFSTGLTRSTNTITVNTSQNIATLSNLTSNGFVKTSGGTGALSIDTATYLTGNQSITLSGDVSGSGTTGITTTIGNDKILEAMLKAVDSPADEECLTYEATGGDFEWQTCGGGGGSPGGSDTQIQFNNAGAFDGSSGLTWNNTNKQLAINDTTLTTTQSLSIGLLLENTTAATVGAQKISPALRLSGKGWATTGSASRDVSVLLDVLPVQGTAPTANFNISSSVNGGTITSMMGITPTQVTLPGTGIMLWTGIGQLNVASGPTFNFQTTGAQTRWSIGNDDIANGFTGGVIIRRTGSASLPSVSFVGDLDNGMYQPGTNQLGLSTAGVAFLTASATQDATFVGSTSTATSGSVNHISSTKTISPASGTGAFTDINSTTTFSASGSSSATFRPLSINYTLNSSGTQSGSATGIFLNATETSLASITHNLMDLQVGGTSKFKITNNGQIVTGGTTPAVSNTSANSCGTTAATIAGNDNNGIITVGATAGTSCTVTFVQAAPNRRECFVNNETTANLARSTYSSTTVSIFTGTFVAGDVLSYICLAR